MQQAPAPAASPALSPATPVASASASAPIGAAGTRWAADAARRDVVAKQAARLFAERGYLGASLRDIAAASGVRSPTLYSHFPSKLHILIEVVNRYFDALAPRLETAARGGGNGARRLRDMLAEAAGTGVEWRDEFLATTNNWEWICTQPDLAGLVRRRDDVLALWRSVLAAGVADGSLRSMDPAATLWVISSAINGMVDQRYTVVDGCLSPPTATLVDIVLGGIATRRPR